MLQQKANDGYLPF